MRPASTNCLQLKKRHIVEGAVSIVIYIVLFAYVTCRAYKLSFTHDEAITYSITTGDSNWLGTANHHPLNTWLVWISSFAGNSELILRLPNVLAFILYIVSIHRLFLRESNKWLTLTAKSLLLLNPFLLEYFSLARGYGISLGLMLMSIYYLLCTFNEEPHYFRKNALLAIICSAGALYANLSLFNIFIAFLALLAFKYFQSARHARIVTRKQLLSYFSLVLLPLVWAVFRLLTLRDSGQLYFGAESLTETFSSVIAYSIDSTSINDRIGMYAVYFTTAVIVCSLLYLIRTGDYSSPLFVVTIVLALAFVGLLTEHYLFTAKYPLERTALYLLPLISIFLYYLLKRIITVFEPSLFAGLASMTLFLVTGSALLYNLAMHYNTNYTYAWKYDANTKAAAKLLKQYADRHMLEGQLLTISNDWIFEPSLNYYIRTIKLPLKPANRDGLNTNTDFIYTQSTEFNDPGFLLIDSFVPSGAKLYVRRLTPNN